MQCLLMAYWKIQNEKEKHSRERSVTKCDTTWGTTENLFQSLYYQLKDNASLCA